MTGGQGQRVEKLTEHSFHVLEAMGFALGVPLGRMQHWSTAVVRQAIQEWVQRRLDDPATRETVAGILADPGPTYYQARRSTPGYRQHIEQEVIRQDADKAWVERVAREEEQKNLAAAVESGKAAILDSAREKNRVTKPKGKR